MAPTLATTPTESFLEVAQKQRKKGLSIRAEQLPPIAEDGRTADPKSRPGDPAQSMVRSFVQAAFSIAKPGDTTRPVRTEFGFHVIRLVNVLPERRVSLEDRRRLLRDES
jgi:hypothetical protein